MLQKHMACCSACVVLVHVRCAFLSFYCIIVPSASFLHASRMSCAFSSSAAIPNSRTWPCQATCTTCGTFRGTSVFSATCYMSISCAMHYGFQAALPMLIASTCFCSAAAANSQRFFVSAVSCGYTVCSVSRCSPSKIAMVASRYTVLSASSSQTPQYARCCL